MTNPTPTPVNAKDFLKVFAEADAKKVSASNLFYTASNASASYADFRTALLNILKSQL